jgi:hypothetical protein
LRKASTLPQQGNCNEHFFEQALILDYSVFLPGLLRVGLSEVMLPMHRAVITIELHPQSPFLQY